MNESEIRNLISNSLGGNKSSLETLIKSIQNKVYSLCLRMLWNPEDALEASQESLLKIITHLYQFDNQSKFDTWVYRVTMNHLIDRYRSASAMNQMTFVEFENDLLSDQSELSEQEIKSPDYPLQLKEMRIACTTALLHCLDVEHRSAYILGEILELDHLDCSVILGITSGAFRKRLERAREKIEQFTMNVCGVMDKKNPCHCNRRIKAAKNCHRLDFNNYPFSTSVQEREDILDFIDKIETGKKTVEHYRKTRNFNSPETISEVFKDILFHPK